MSAYAARRAIEDALRATGLSWTISDGGKHQKVHIEGRLVGVFNPQRRDRDGRNILDAIRRYVKCRSNGSDGKPEERRCASAASVDHP